MAVKLNKIISRRRAFFLAYDQGLEHGPSDFNDKNVNPSYIIKIAKEGNFDGIIFQKGIAEKYKNEIKASKIPLILKLNGKTSLYKGEPISSQLCSVKEAIALNAKSVGYTIYIGSEHESKMFQEFEKIEKEAHKNSLQVIAWIYPRGSSIEGKDEGKLMAYSARVGLELGADIVKLHYNGKLKDLRWAVQAAGKTKILVAGGEKKLEEDILQIARDVVISGAYGLAIGRNIWQNKNPLELTKKIKENLSEK